VQHAAAEAFQPRVVGQFGRNQRLPHRHDRLQLLKRPGHLLVELPLEEAETNVTIATAAPPSQVFQMGEFGVRRIHDAGASAPPRAADYNSPVNIILIGYRGCGKTTLGKVLAERLWLTFVDVDVATCQRFGNDSIAAIWSEHGEPQWRRVEVEVTQELVKGSDKVIGLGGGTLMQAGARQAVEEAENAVRFYLKCEPEVLLQRIGQDDQSAATRPNLTQLGGGIEEITAMLAEREPIYLAVADQVLDVSNLAPNDAVRYIIAKC